MAKTLLPASSASKKEYLKRIGSVKYAAAGEAGKPYEISCSSKTTHYMETARAAAAQPEPAVLLEESYSPEG